MKFIILSVIMLLATIYGALAYPGTYTTFTDGTSSGNLSFETGGLQNKYLNLALGSAVLEGYFYLAGFNATTNYAFATFEDASTEGFVAGSNTLTAVTGQGSGSTYSLRLEGTYLFYSYKDFNSVNVSSINLSFQAKDLTGGYVLFVGDHTSGRGYRLSITASNTVVLYGTATGSSSTICDLGSSWNTIGLEINNLNHTVNGYCNGTRKVTDWGVWVSNPSNITRLYISGEDSYFDDFVLQGAQTGSYPYNVTVWIDGVRAWNYGEANESYLDHQVLVNLTENFSTISNYPTTVGFSTNSSGILEYSSIYFVDSARNFSFTFYDEEDGTIFALNDSNTTLTITCPETSYDYPITSGTTNIELSCETFDFLKVSVGQEGETYWRSLIVPPSAGSSPALDWYLVNLNNRSVVQVILNLDDTTGGEWTGSTARLSRNVNNTADATIIEQEFDVDNKVYLYLMQDELYDLTITNNVGLTWTGSFIADTAEEKTITLPGAGFYQHNYWEDDLRVNHTFSVVEHYAGVLVTDLGQNSNYASWQLWSLENDTVIAYNDTSISNWTTILFYYTDADNIVGNHSYKITLRFNHSVLGMQTVERSFGDYSGGVSPGHWGEDWATITKWFTFLFLLVVMFSFGQKDAHIGLAIVFIIGIVFKALGWLDYVSIIQLSVLGLIAVANWWRKEEVSPG